jgi:hypothetical protein
MKLEGPRKQRTGTEWDTPASVCAADINLMGKNKNNRKKNPQALSYASKEICVQVNTEKTKCMFMSRHQTAGQTYCIKLANKSENVAKV